MFEIEKKYLVSLNRILLYCQLFSQFKQGFTVLPII
jgi:hypothetical protein